MANLKDELDQYLLLQSDQKKNFKLDMKMPVIKVPEIKSLFGGKSQPPEANGWLQDTKDSCCPKLVSHRRKLYCLHLVLTYIRFHFQFVFSVEDAEDFRIFSVFKYGHLLYVNLSTLYTRIDTEGSEICAPIFIGQFILHTEVKSKSRDFIHALPNSSHFNF